MGMGMGMGMRKVENSRIPPGPKARVGISGTNLIDQHGMCNFSEISNAKDNANDVGTMTSAS